MNGNWDKNQMFQVVPLFLYQDIIQVLVGLYYVLYNRTTASTGIYNIEHRRIHVLEQIEATTGEFSLSCVIR